MMDHLPLGNVPMLVSSVNCLLRDREFDDLDDLCSYYDQPREDLEKLLSDEGYAYDGTLNRIVAL